MKKLSLIMMVIFVSATVRAELKVWNGTADLWGEGSNWTPAGVPTINDEVLVDGGMAVILDNDGVCDSFVVTNGGFLIVNHQDRTLQVANNGKVYGSGSELRVNSGQLTVGGSVTLFDGGQMVIEEGTAKATVGSLDFSDGNLEWNAGTLRFTDNLWMDSGEPITTLGVGPGRTLEVISLEETAIELYVGSAGMLTLTGGVVTCDAFIKTSLGTVEFNDGTLQINGEGLEWGNMLNLEGSTSSEQPTLILDGFYFPSAALTNGFTIAPTANRQGYLKLTDYTILETPGSTIANGIGSIGEAILTDTSQWKSGSLIVGGAGMGIVTITNNSRVTDCSNLEIGRDSTSTGMVTVTGSGSTWSGYWDTKIAYNGVAIIEVADGATMSLAAQISDTEFARHSNSRAEVTVTGSGSQFEISPDSNEMIYFGHSGHASMVVSNGASVIFNEFTSVGETTGGRGDFIVTGSGSALTINDDLWLGYEGTGTLQILDGATAHTDQAKLGEFPNGVGQVTISGSGSYWHGGGYQSIGGEFLVGRYGRGEITVENGGTLHSSGYSEMGLYSGSRGVVTVTEQDSLWAVSHTLNVGSPVNGATGLLTIANGGLVTVADTISLFEGGTVVLNGGAQGAGTLDAKTLDLSDGDTITGDGYGILRLDDITSRPTNWTLPASLQIGSSNHTGEVNWSLDSGKTITVDDELCIGYSKSATFVNRGLIAADTAVIGQWDGTHGETSIAGNSADMNITDHLTVGDAGTGSLVMTDGANVSADTITVGIQSTSTGSVVHISASTLFATNITETGLVDVKHGTVSLNAGTITGNYINFSSNSFLVGSGTIYGVMTNAGTISPGFSPGELTVNGSLELKSTSQLNLELCGTNITYEYDRLIVNGNATMNGTLTVSTNEYAPTLGDHFDLLDWYTLTPGSTFDELDLPELPAGREWYTGDLYIDGSIMVSLPVAWLEKYGLSPTNNPYADPDQDSVSTWAEYTADTNPTNGNSYLQVDIGYATNMPTIYFDSSSNRIYLLLGCSNLVEDTWDVVPDAGPRPGIGGEDSFSDTNSVEKGSYYRLEVELE